MVQTLRERAVMLLCTYTTYLDVVCITTIRSFGASFVECTYNNPVCRTPIESQAVRIRGRYSFSIMLRHIMPSSLTYLLTPLCRVLLEKLTGLQLVKKFPAFYGTRKFITALTSVRQLSLSWASPIQSTYPHPTSWKSILILSTHLRLGLSSGLFPSGFPTKTLYTPLYSPIRATCPTHLILLYLQGEKIVKY